MPVTYVPGAPAGPVYAGPEVRYPPAVTLPEGYDIGPSTSIVNRGPVQGAADPGAVPGPSPFEIAYARIFEELRYVDFQDLPGTATTTAQLVLERPDSRRCFLMVVNQGTTNPMRLRFGSSPTTSIGYRIEPNGGYILFDTIVPQNDLYLIATANTTNFWLFYGNKQEFLQGA